MSIFSLIFSYLLFVPGLKELLLLIIVFGFVKSFRKEVWYLALSRSILISSLFLIAFHIASNYLNDNNFFLLPFIFILIAGVASLCLRIGKPLLLKLCLPITISLYALFHWQFTFVHQKITTVATYELQGDGRVQFNFSGDCSGIQSKPLVAYLAFKGGSEVKLTIYVLYHFGSMAGFDLAAIDDKKFPQTDSWSGGTCSGAGNILFPKFYFGMRGLTFSQMYEGWQPSKLGSEDSL